MKKALKVFEAVFAVAGLYFVVTKIIGFIMAGKMPVFVKNDEDDDDFDDDYFEEDDDDLFIDE